VESQILDTLVQENRGLKKELERCGQELDEMRERVDTLKYLEEEASEENEVLRYKVLSLECAMEGETDLSEIKIVDQLRLAKREMQSELEVLRTQVKSFKMLFGTQDTTQEDDEG